MTKQLIKCLKCDETVSCDSDDPNEISDQTGFVLIDVDKWLCSKCIDDHFKAEGC